MSISDHVSRVTKRSARIITSDPSTETLEVLTVGNTIMPISLFDLPTGFEWPKEGENWSVYQENGLWRLGHKFMNEEDRARLGALKPGESYTTPEDEAKQIQQIRDEAFQPGDLKARIIGFQDDTVETTYTEISDQGFLRCDGRFISQDLYERLFEIVRHKFNGNTDPGDGTFKLPTLSAPPIQWWIKT